MPSYICYVSQREPRRVGQAVFMKVALPYRESMWVDLNNNLELPGISIIDRHRKSVYLYINRAPTHGEQMEIYV